MMSLIYVTGIAGAGKTTVAAELKRRGFEVYGTDEDGLAAFYNIKTGLSLGSQVAAEIRTEHWRREHAWKVPREAIEQLAKRAKNKPVFVCGVVSNDNEFLDLFSHVLALSISKEVLIQRLRDRADNNFGKLDHELRDVLSWQEYAAEEYGRMGATLIDATQPIDRVADDIIKISDATR